MQLPWNFFIHTHIHIYHKIFQNLFLYKFKNLFKFLLKLFNKNKMKKCNWLLPATVKHCSMLFPDTFYTELSINLRCSKFWNWQSSMPFRSPLIFQQDLYSSFTLSAQQWRIPPSNHLRTINGTDTETRWRIMWFCSLNNTKTCFILR